jgi:uncharacterized protein YecT (DUF1311 family)
MQPSTHRSRRVFFRGTIVLLLAAVIPAALVCGQITPLARLLSSTNEGRLADQELNSNYQQAMRTLPGRQREQLRKAQRAWLVFLDRNSDAIRAAATSLGIPVSSCDQLDIAEIGERSEDFARVQTMTGSQSDASMQLQRTDEELNVIYQKCIAKLAAGDVARLRVAQRAWITFRDASRYAGPEFCALITFRRTKQLNDFYISGGYVARPPGQEKPDRTIPDPFERAR